MSTPTAILLAGVLIALALFFGLRATNTPATPSAAPAAAPAADPSPPPAPPAPPPVDLAVSRQHATNALAYHRGTLRQDCYLPVVASEAVPPALDIEFTFTFDPAGVQAMRGVVETSAESRPTVTQCVLDKLPPLRIPAPGQVVSAVVVLSFP
ncbi:hypothetical protein [Nannocystis radixulma]|uniref:AgmX/PglI C-terminal domain-containing protein n=1 Tax=Nannocystis radixulma TaxID=2995305 RepID=A0ABT5AX20_9BACT|nr:hypothetical protein [Nannocystis radixulma]MDC0666387.1 hypothetical protein [Nannocystis radixulma]